MIEDATDDRIEVVRERYPFLEHLSETVAEKRSLPEALDMSRSTVDRAIRALEDHGLVARVKEGYTATELGRLCAERYRGFVEDERALFDAAPALDDHAEKLPLPPTLVTDGEITNAPDRPHRLYERLLTDLRTADEADLLANRVADTRPIRLCRSRVATDSLTGGAYLSETAFERVHEEFPHLASALCESDDFGLRTGPVPGAEMYLTAAGSQQTVTVLIGDEGAPTTAFRSTADRAIAWAESLFSTLSPASEPAELSVPDDGDGWLTDVDGGADSLEGVRVIEASYFDERTPADAATAWQVGPRLVDTYYGIAFEREGSNGDSAVEALVNRLDAGESHVLLGPPGAGKTTTCRGVVARWIESGRGNVILRSASTHTQMASAERLAERGRDIRGHTLVVIEDLEETGAASVLRLSRLLAEEPEVTLLIEARERVWDDLSRTLTDTRLLETARSLQEYRLEPLTESTCRRAIEAFETVTGSRVAVDAAELAEQVSAGETGGLYQLSYRLVAHAADVPWRTDEPTPTGLDADTRAAHDAIRELDAGREDSFALETSLVLAALVAAGREPRRVEAHAVAATGDGYRHRRVEEVLSTLDGRLLFHRNDEEYGTQHPTWAVRFLEAVLDREGRSGAAAFQRALSSVFRLIDDAAVREAAARWVGAEPPTVAEPLRPADELVEDLYNLAIRHAGLVPLFEPIGGAGIELPATTSPERRLHCVRDRMLGWHANSDAERARAVAHELATRARGADIDDGTTARFVSQSHRTRGELAEDEGELENARELFDASLEHALDSGDVDCEIAARNALAWLSIQAGAFDDAADHLSAARSLGDPDNPSAELATTVYYQGELARRRRELATAEERLREAIDLDRYLGNDENIHSTYNALGMVAEGREAFDRAEEYYRRSVELKREAGDRRSLAKTLFNLGDLLVKRGDFDEAETCLDRSRAIADEYGMDRFAANLAGGYGRLALERNAFEEAETRYREQRRRYEEHDYQQGVASAMTRLGDVARERGDRQTAVEQYLQAIRAFLDVDAPADASDVFDRLVDLLTETGASAEAAKRCRTVLAWAEEGGFDDLCDHIESRSRNLTAKSD